MPRVLARWLLRCPRRARGNPRSAEASLTHVGPPPSLFNSLLSQIVRARVTFIFRASQYAMDGHQPLASRTVHGSQALYLRLPLGVLPRGRCSQQTFVLS